MMSMQIFKLDHSGILATRCVTVDPVQLPKRGKVMEVREVELMTGSGRDVSTVRKLLAGLPHGVQSRQQERQGETTDDSQD
ncbi:hypothetical protein ACOMHN_029161 [Nucella lapillus]